MDYSISPLGRQKMFEHQGQVVLLLLSSTEVTDSNLGFDIMYPDRDLSQYFLRKFQNSTTNQATTASLHTLANLLLIKYTTLDVACSERLKLVAKQIKKPTEMGKEGVISLWVMYQAPSTLMIQRQ
jgi:hypothetical protein